MKNTSTHTDPSLDVMRISIDASREASSRKDLEIDELEAGARFGKKLKENRDESVTGSTTSTQDAAATTTATKGSARKISRAGSSSNACVYLVLFIAAIGFGVGAYFLLATSEQQTFQSQFQSFARETAEIAENNAENTFGQLRTLATAITSIAQASDGVDFPNVLVPFFDLRVPEIAELTGAEMIMWAPFVEKKDRLGYEKISHSQQEWINQDYVSSLCLNGRFAAIGTGRHKSHFVLYFRVLFRSITRTAIPRMGNGLS